MLPSTYISSTFNFMISILKKKFNLMGISIDAIFMNNILVIFSYRLIGTYILHINSITDYEII